MTELFKYQRKDFTNGNGSVTLTNPSLTDNSTRYYTFNQDQEFTISNKNDNKAGTDSDAILIKYIESAGINYTDDAGVEREAKYDFVMVKLEQESKDSNFVKVILKNTVDGDEPLLETAGAATSETAYKLIAKTDFVNGVILSITNDAVDGTETFKATFTPMILGKSVSIKVKEGGSAVLNEAIKDSFVRTSIDFTSADKDEIDMSEMTLKNVNLQAINIEKADLINSDFENVDLRQANLKNVDLEGSNFVKVNFTQVDFTTSNLKNVIFNGCDISKSTIKADTVFDSKTQFINYTKGLNIVFTDTSDSNPKFAFIVKGFAIVGGNLIGPYIDFRGAQFDFDDSDNQVNVPITVSLLGALSAYISIEYDTSSGKYALDFGSNKIAAFVVTSSLTSHHKGYLLGSGLDLSITSEPPRTFIYYDGSLQYFSGVDFGSYTDRYDFRAQSSYVDSMKSGQYASQYGMSEYNMKMEEYFAEDSSVWTGEDNLSFEYSFKPIQFANQYAKIAMGEAINGRRNLKIRVSDYFYLNYDSSDGYIHKLDNISYSKLSGTFVNRVDLQYVDTTSVDWGYNPIYNPMNFKRMKKGGEKVEVPFGWMNAGGEAYVGVDRPVLTSYAYDVKKSQLKKKAQPKKKGGVASPIQDDELLDGRLMYDTDTMDRLIERDPVAYRSTGSDVMRSGLYFPSMGNGYLSAGDYPWKGWKGNTVGVATITYSTNELNSNIIETSVNANRDYAVNYKNLQYNISSGNRVILGFEAAVLSLTFAIGVAALVKTSKKAKYNF